MVLNILKSSQIHSLIDWDSIFLPIIELAHFSTNKAKLNSPPQYHSKKELQAYYDDFEADISQKSLDQIITEHNNLTRIPANNSILISLDFLKKDRILSILELNEIALLLETSDFLKPNLKKVLNETRMLISENSELIYDRHPLLLKIQSEIKALESEMRGAISKLANNPPYQNAIQFKGHDVLHDYFVISIKSGSYEPKMGKIIQQSDSKQTFYVEPKGLKKQNQLRQDLLSEIKQLIFKIRSQICLELKNHTKFLKQFYLKSEALDLRYTKIRYFLQKNHSIPKLTDKKRMELIDFTHPLIDDSVPNSVLIENKKGMVISGPNTGGKTVCLKSILLSQIFLQKGLGINARNSEIYPFESLFYFGSDSQKIDDGLSSFSSEIKNYMHLINHLGRTNLILFDEIFNSTSSEEASALAMALFKEIHQRSDAMIITSTHHHMLKAISHQSHDYLSAHMLINPDTFTPRYKLSIGTPGSSYALEIFNKLTEEFKYAESIYESSKVFIDKKNIQYENMINEVARKSHLLHQELSQIKKLKSDLENQKEAINSEYRLKKENELNDYTKKINKVLNQAEHLKNQAKRGQIQGKKELERKVYTIKSNLPLQEKRESQDLNEKYSHLKPPDTIKENHTYFSLSLKRNIIVKKVFKKDVQVQLKNFTLKLKITDLRVSNKKQVPNKVNIFYQSNTEASVEIDCRGMRLDNFEHKIQLHISQLDRGDIPYLSVIHGHGTGALKSWLRDFLKENKNLYTWESPRESLDGSTTIKLA